MLFFFAFFYTYTRYEENTLYKLNWCRALNITLVPPFVELKD